MNIEQKVERLLNKMGRGSKARLAEYLGVNRSYIGRWINDPTYGIPRDKVKGIANFFGVTADYLLDDTQDIPVNTKVPVLGMASCGVPNGYFGDDVQYIDLPSNIAGAGVYGVIADGDSMLPKIQDRSIVICNKDLDISNGDIVHYTINGESGIKRYREKDNEIILEPLNPAYESVRYPGDEIESIRLAKCISVINQL